MPKGQFGDPMAEAASASMLVSDIASARLHGTACSHFLPKRGKSCARPCAAGSFFCPCHSPQTFRCPDCGNALSGSSKLKSHRFKCNAKKIRDATEALPFFRRDMNAGTEDENEDGDGERMNEALGGLSSINEDCLARIAERVSFAFQTARLHIHDCQEANPKFRHAFAAEQTDSSARGASVEARGAVKHGTQTIALASSMEREGLLEVGFAFFELGAGNGGLTATVAAATCYGASAYTLVDRAGTKKRLEMQIEDPARPEEDGADRRGVRGVVGGTSADHSVDAASGSVGSSRGPPAGAVRDSGGVAGGVAEAPKPSVSMPTLVRHTKLGEAHFSRLRVDIRHLSLRGLETCLPAPAPAVIMSKHLCGAATDLALRCAVNGVREGVQVQGMAIALCCHHFCNWRDYCGKDFLLRCGFTRRDFGALRRMSSWAPSLVESSGTAPRAEGPRVPPDPGVLDRAGRRLLGWRIKRLLDIGRMDYLMSAGFDAKLSSYVAEEVTPENVCLMVTTRSLSR